MIHLLRILMIVVTCLTVQRSKGQFRRYWNHQTRYKVPVAEPEPEPEPFVQLFPSSSLAEPEPLSRRLSRRLVNRQRLLQSLLVTTTTPPGQRTSTAGTSLINRRTNLLRLLQSSFPN